MPCAGACKAFTKFLTCYILYLMNINVYFEDDLGRDFKFYADRMGVKRNAILRKLTRQWVEEQKENQSDDAEEFTHDGIHKSISPDMKAFIREALSKTEEERREYDKYKLFDRETRYDGLKGIDMSKSIFDDIDFEDKN